MCSIVKKPTGPKAGSPALSSTASGQTSRWDVPLAARTEAKSSPAVVPQCCYGGPGRLFATQRAGGGAGPHIAFCSRNHATPCCAHVEEGAPFLHPKTPSALDHVLLEHSMDPSPTSNSLDLLTVRAVDHGMGSTWEPVRKKRSISGPTPGPRWLICIVEFDKASACSPSCPDVQILKSC